MGKAGIALGVVVFMVLVTMADMAWSTTWGAVAYMTGDPSWNSASVKDDAVRFGTSYRQRFSLQSTGDDDDLVASFQITNASDYPLRWAGIKCDVVSNGVNGRSSATIEPQWGEVFSDRIIVPAHATVVLSYKEYWGKSGPLIDQSATTCSADFSAATH